MFDPVLTRKRVEAMNAGGIMTSLRARLLGRRGGNVGREISPQSDVIVTRNLTAVNDSPREL